MKSVSEVLGLLELWEKKYNYKITSAEQGSPDWKNLKLGVISASNAKAAVAKVDSDTRLSYMANLVAQVATGIFPELEGIASLEWGKLYEDSARANYEFETGFSIVRVPFVFFDDSFRVGCSPDGFVSATKGEEIKSPHNSANFIKFLCDSSVSADWKWQMQMNMWVTGAELWDFSMYDPRMHKMSMARATYERDEKMQKTLNDAIPQFIQDMDKMLGKVGMRFGDQWERLKGGARASSSGAPLPTPIGDNSTGDGHE